MFLYEIVDNVCYPKSIPNRQKTHYYNMFKYDEASLALSYGQYPDFYTSNSYFAEYDVIVSFSDYTVLPVDKDYPELGEYAICCVTEDYSLTSYLAVQKRNTHYCEFNFGNFYYLDRDVRFNVPRKYNDYFGLKNYTPSVTACNETKELFSNSFKYPFFDVVYQKKEKSEYVDVVSSVRSIHRSWSRFGWGADWFYILGKTVNYPKDFIFSKNNVYSYYFKDVFIGGLGGGSDFSDVKICV